MKHPARGTASQAASTKYQEKQEMQENTKKKSGKVDQQIRKTWKTKFPSQKNKESSQRHSQPGSQHQIPGKTRNTGKHKEKTRKSSSADQEKQEIKIPAVK